MRATGRQPSSGLLIALGLLLVLTHALLALSASLGKSMTADEIAYLTAGQVYNSRGDYRFQPENGNLPQRWAALPATLSGVPLPSMTNAAWRGADVWVYGHEFFYGAGVHDADRRLFAGRAMMVLFSLGTGLLIFFWSRSLFGWKGAFLSLGLFVFCPAFLAHGALATSDVMMTFFFLACVGAWWRHLEKPGPAGAALSAALFGLACVAKFSSALLVPMFALVALGWVAGRPDRWRVPLLRVARSALIHVVTAWAIIWLFYGFRFSAFAPALATGAGFYRGDWNWILTDMGWQRPILVVLRDWHILPEAFLYGFAFVVQFARERAAFLNGEYGIHGWLGFFPYAFLVKTTVPFLLLLLISAGVGVGAYWKHRLESATAYLARCRAFLPLAALLVVYGATSLMSHLNIGHRHLLPIYPVLFIGAGALGTWLDLRRPWAALLVAALTLWHVGESWRIRPHYLAYFNQFAGGPANGWRHLVDSSLDWGQDLPGLKSWLDRESHGEPVYLSYFGAGEPDYYGIRARRLPFLNGFRIPQPWIRLEAGVYCVSATMLQQVYSPFHGPWTLEREKEYQQLRGSEPAFDVYLHDPAQRVGMDRLASPEKWRQAWTQLDLMRFARLCHYLRVRTPDANIGYSILIYRLSPEEIAAATTGSLVDWQALIDRTISRGGH